jgi:hypothetical protein
MGMKGTEGHTPVRAWIRHANFSRLKGVDDRLTGLSMAKTT